MAASMWEVTRLILGEPGDAAGIAQAHGFTTAEVADLLPLFADNVTTSWEGGAPPPAAPEALPGESPEELAARWLGELGAHRDAGTLDLVSYDSFGAAGFGLDGADPGLELDFDSRLPTAVHQPEQVTTFDAGGDDFGGGPAGGGADPEPDDDVPDHDDQDTGDGHDGPDGRDGHDGHDGHDGTVDDVTMSGLDDDPFHLGPDALGDLPDGHQDGGTGLHDAPDGGAAFE
jgi:hypothetical protein